MITVNRWGQLDLNTLVKGDKVAFLSRYCQGAHQARPATVTKETSTRVTITVDGQEADARGTYTFNRKTGHVIGTANDYRHDQLITLESMEAAKARLAKQQAFGHAVYEIQKLIKERCSHSMADSIRPADKQTLLDLVNSLAVRDNND